MPYKISGTLSDTARIIIIKESDWSIESNTEESSGSYEVDSLDSSYKWIISRKSDGEVLGYGYITPIEYISPGRGVFGGGFGGAYLNVVDYITISSNSNTTDLGDLTIARRELAATSNGSSNRGIFGGGLNASATILDVIDYITISNTGNATDFGNLSDYAKRNLAATSNGLNDRGVFGGGVIPTLVATDIIDYVTISSIGNATDFGNLTAANRYLSATSNGTSDRAVFGGGEIATPQNKIDYITISSTGDATDFGDLVSAKRYLAATSNNSNNRGVFGAGLDGPQSSVDYITISSTGNATDFGDLTLARYNLAATSNGTNERGVFAGGYSAINIIDYITISSIGDADDFGDLTTARYALAATSNA